MQQSSSTDQAHETLKRSLSLPLVVLYGLGVTIGAGIYVLIGATAQQAGLYAPASFLIAAFVMAFTACSFGEFAGRHPVSAGEAAYVHAGFKSQVLFVFVGLSVVLVGTVSAAAISVGSAGYVQAIIDMPEHVLVLAMGGVAAWGISQSVMLAAILTLIEVGGLLLIVGAGFWKEPDLMSRFGEVLSLTAEAHVWPSILFASLLAFFAFIGFEDMVNIAEEVKRPERNLPLAIALTLVIATVLYFIVVSVAVLTVPPSDLAASKRLLRQGSLPSVLGWVNPVTRTLLSLSLNGIGRNHVAHHTGHLRSRQCCPHTHQAQANTGSKGDFYCALLGALRWACNVLGVALQRRHEMDDVAYGKACSWRRRR